jgi:hypothetical protein
LTEPLQQSWKAPVYEPVAPQFTNQFLEEETYCVPSQHLSPTSSCSFDESDDTLHYAYGYGCTNNSMLDHNQTISGNDYSFHSWDDYSSGSSHASPIGCNPVTNSFVYKQEQTIEQLLPLDFSNSYWLLDQPTVDYQPLPDYQFFDFNIPSQPLYNNTNTWAI